VTAGPVRRGGPPAPSGSAAELARPEVRSLAAYHLDQTACRFKLDQNEAPWDLPRRLKRRVAAALAARDWSRYPDFHGDELRRPLAERWRWPMAGVLVGNGSNELLAAVLEAVARPGGEVLGTAPSFGLYPVFALRAGARWRPLGPRRDLALPLAELAAEIERDPTRPVVLASPNNPTGDAASPAAVAGLLERLEAPLLLDNAYGEFCRHDYRPLLDRFAHLVLFRTFSKAWSLAGLRLGYLLAHPELVAELVKVKLPYNLGWAGIEAGRQVLAAAPALERRVRVLTGRRERWARRLAELGLEVFPSQANFLLVRFGEGSERVRRGLAERGILVREVGHYPGLAGCLRIGVGDGRAERALIAALEEILGDEGSREKEGGRPEGVESRVERDGREEGEERDEAREEESGVGGGRARRTGSAR
jgi:histidinol-phosphate aminotransferase